MLLPEAVEIARMLKQRPWEKHRPEEEDRVNVMVYAGYGIHGEELVVFVDRFEGIVFHAEPGDRNFGWMFW